MIIKLKKLFVISVLLNFFVSFALDEQYLYQWHNTHFKNKLSQKELSLVTQRMYYLFELFNKIFKAEAVQKKGLLPISNAISEINVELSKVDKGSKKLSIAFEELNKEIKNHLPKQKKSKETGSELFFDLIIKLKIIYSLFLSELKNKKITFGPDKNKNLPEVNNIKLPSKTMVERKFKDAQLQKLKKLGLLK